MDEHHFMTHRLADYVRAEALRRTFTSVADEVGLTEGTIRLLFVVDPWLRMSPLFC